MKKIFLYFLVIAFSLSGTEIYANTNRANSLKRTLTVQYNRFNKTPTGKVKILKDIANLSKKYSKDNDVILMLKNIKSTYRVATECDIGFYLEGGQCHSMSVVDNGILPTNENSTKSVSTECKLGTYLNNGKCVDMVVLDNGIKADTVNTGLSTSSSTNDTKASLLQKINNTQSAIDSAKVTLEKGKSIISEVESYINLQKKYKDLYQAQIDKFKVDYTKAINDAKNNSDIEQQQYAVYFAKNGLSFSNAAIQTTQGVINKYNKLIDDLTVEMNSNIDIVQKEINRLDTEIQKTQTSNDDHKKINSNLENLIYKNEVILEALKAQYNSL